MTQLHESDQEQMLVYHCICQNIGFNSKKLKNYRCFWIEFQKFYIFAADK